MDAIRMFWQKLRGTFEKDRSVDELDEELRNHLDLLTSENVARGMSAEDARRAARMTLGGDSQIKEAYRDQAGLPFLEVLLQDLRYGSRILLKSPTFTITAALTLALGLGANTAIFSVVNAVLLRPLPYQEPKQLISIRGGQSWPDLNDIREESKSVASLGAYWPLQFDLLGRGEPEQVDGALVSLDLFETLGVPPEMGRTLTAKDDVVSGARVVVLSHAFWQQRFGADRNVIGKTVALSGNTYEVIGVMPPRFWLPTGESQFYLPFRVGYPEAATARGVHAQYAIFRMREGFTRAQVQGELDSIAAGLEKFYPAENRGRKFVAVDLKERVVGKVRTAVLVLLGASLLVLLIANLNFASLLIAKASARAEEMRVRAALGASASRLVRQAITESVMISLGGAVIGLAFAAMILRLLLLLEPNDLPRLQSISMDHTVLAFSLVLSLCTGCAFGLIPALQVILPESRRDLKLGTAGSKIVRSRSRFRHALIVGEFAVTLVLLCGAGLLLRSMARLNSVDPGFETGGVMTARIALEPKKYATIPAQNRFYAQLEDRLKQIPGATGAALVSELPLGGNRIPHNIVFAGRPPVPEGSEPDVLTNLISPDYFSTLRVPLRKGRAFAASDREGAPLVAVINDSMANQFYPGEDPIGKQIAFARANGPRQWISIVGVVADMKEFGPDQETLASIYLPMQQKQEPWRRWSGIVVRGDQPDLAGKIKQAVWSVDPNVPVTKVQPITALMASTLAQRKFTALLLVIFAVTALALAIVGLYGVIAYVVVQRTREIGVRMALGAQRLDVIWMVFRQGLTMGLIGVAIGTLGSLYATKGLQSLLFGISARDPGTFAAVACLLIAVSLIAGIIPAWRAAQVNPSSALRAE